MLKLHRQIKLDRYTVPYGEVWYIASSMQLQEEEFFQGKAAISVVLMPFIIYQELS